MNSHEETTDQSPPLDESDRPIHTPGAIQPHGVQLSLSESDLTILQVSNNTQEHLGIRPQDLLNQPLHTLISPQQN